MNESPKTVVEVTPHSPVVQQGEEIEIKDIADLFSGLVEPLAKSKIIEEEQKTKRLEIEADVTKTSAKYLYGIVAVILAIAIIALFRDKDQLTEKIIFAVIGFIGGHALGKSNAKAKE